MAHSEITRVTGVVGVVVDHGHAEITRVVGFVGSADHGHAEITRVTGRVAVTGGSHAEITRVTGVVFVPVAVQARAGLDQEVSAVADTVLDGSSSTGPWATATWTVVSDSRVPLPAIWNTPVTPIELSPDTDSNITVNFPPYPETYTVVCKLTVSDGITESIDTLTVRVWAWIFWRALGGRLVPSIRYRNTGPHTDGGTP